MLVCFDLDGTLVNCDHRLHHVKQKPKNWKKFFQLISNDTLNVSIALLYDTLVYMKNDVILVTGRPESTRNDTENFLKNNNVYGFKELIMRNPKDHRPDHIVKTEQCDYIVDKYKTYPDIWFEDRSGVINALRAKGIFVVDVEQKRFLNNDA